MEGAEGPDESRNKKITYQPTLYPAYTNCKQQKQKKIQENSQEQERKQVGYFPNRLVGSCILSRISHIFYPVFPFLLANNR